jgi:hypothetical protein
MKQTRRHWSIKFTLCMCVGLAQAELLVYEGFDFSSGYGESLFDDGTGFGWGGTEATWTKHSSDSTRTNQRFERYSAAWSYIDVLGNQLNTAGGVYARWYNGDLWSPWAMSYARRDFASMISTPVGGTLWMSLLASRNTPSSNSRDVKIYLGGMPNRGAIIGKCQSGTNHMWGLYHYTTKDQPTLGSDLIVEGEPDLLVLKLSFTESTTVARLWINPAVIGAGEAGLGTADCSQTWPTASEGYTGVQCGSNEAMYGYFDEIRVGETAEDVLPFSAPPSPKTLIFLR